MDAQVNTSSIKVDSAAEALLAVMADRGVDYLFGNAGTDFPSIIEALSKAGTDSGKAPIPVTVPHENLAVAMAHGYFLATGRPQAVFLHVNVGTANAICGLLNAARDNVPILVAAGRTPIMEDGAFGARTVFIHWGQEMFDQAGMVREAVKWDYELRRPDQVEQVVDRALNVAMSEPRGPVYLTLPREVLADGAGDFTFNKPARTLPAGSSAPAPTDIDAVLRLLNDAERPLLITGSYGQNPEDVPALAEFAERFGVGVMGHRPRYTFLPNTHANHVGYEPGPILPEADLVLVLDCDVPWIPTLHSPRPDARIVQIGTDPIFQKYPMRSFPADRTVSANSRQFLDAMIAQAPEPGNLPEARLNWIAAHGAKWREVVARQVAGDGTGSLTAAAVAGIIERHKRADDVVLTETAFPIGALTFDEPSTFFGTSAAGGLGGGLGGSLGMKLAWPDRRIIAMIGDGSYMFGNPTPAHFVAASLKLPTLTVILNNRMWGAVRRATLSLYPDGAAAKSNNAPLTMLEPAPAYEKVVEASGGWGARAETIEEMDAAVVEGLRVIEEEGRSAVINVLTVYSDDAALADARK